MRKINYVLLIGMLLASNMTPLFATAQEFGGKSEKLQLIVDTTKDLLALNHLTTQEGPNFSDRSSRGLFLPLLAGYVINKGVQGIQTMINDRKNRFIANYSFSDRGHYFYDQISTVSAIDPVGLQFKGFKILRLVKNETGVQDTILFAKFILDTTEGRLGEMMNNGIFHLRLDSIMVLKSRVKAPKNVKKLNIDFEIVFNSSFRGDDGQIHPDAPLGKFMYSLREAPLDPEDPDNREYFYRLDSKKPALVGEAFLVPRSSGFYKTKNGTVENCWGQGLYSINVTVKETSKPKFIDKLIIFTSDPTLNIGSSVLQKKYATVSSSSPASSSAAKPATKTATPTKKP